MLLSHCNSSRSNPIFDKNATEIDQRDREHLYHYPSIPDEVIFGLTTFYFIAYCFIYLVVYIQLWMILFYHHKRCSFQTVFLYLCLFWSGLRATLFSFYIVESVSGTDLPMFFYWLLYCFPVCLQFFILCLLNLYFAQVAFKVLSKYAAHPQNYIIPLRSICILSSLVFLAMNIACAVVVHRNKADDAEKHIKSSVQEMIVARVLVNDILFVVGAISLTCCLFKIAKSNSANILLRAKGATVCRAVSTGLIIVLLYVSRSIYNLIAISPLRCSEPSIYDLDWFNVSDQAELADLTKNSSYVLYGLVIFLWELLPTSLTVLFFKVCRSENGSTSGSLCNIRTTGRVYFFDKQHQQDDQVQNDVHFAPSYQRVDTN